MRRILPELQPRKLTAPNGHRAVDCAGQPGKCSACGGDLEQRRTCKACKGSGYDHAPGCLWESTREHRVRIEKTLADKYGVKPGTIRAYSTDFGKKSYRRPERDRVKIFADIEEYGAVRFKKDGTPVKSTFGSGPSRDEVLDTTPVGRNGHPARN